MADEFNDEDSATRRLAPHHLLILEHLARGSSHRAIGAALHLSPKTVAYHVRRLQQRLGVSNTAALVAASFVLGLLSTSDWPVQITGMLDIDPLDTLGAAPGDAA